MKVAFVGKGGSGKTTLASLFALRAAGSGAPVLALDADIHQNLAVALGADEEVAAGLPALPDHLTALKEWLRGDNPRIPDAASMIKTTPPGRGSRLVTVTEDNPVYTPPCGRSCPGSGSGWPGGSPRTISGWRATTPRPARWSSCSHTSSTVRASTWWST